MIIYYLPLDKRPCSINYFKIILDSLDINYNILSKGKDLLNILKHIKDKKDTFFIISLDAYLYGNLISSRQYNVNYLDTRNRLFKLYNLLKRFKNIRFYLFSHITRLSITIKTNRDMNLAKSIENLSHLLYKKEYNKVRSFLHNIDKAKFFNYLKVRARNFLVNKQFSKLVFNKKNINFVIGVDDITKEALNTREYFKLLKVNKNILFGLDELPYLLLCKLFLDELKIPINLKVIPLNTDAFYKDKTIYENLPLFEILKKQVDFLDIKLVDDFKDADINLIVYNFLTQQKEAVFQKDSDFKDFYKDRIKIVFDKGVKYIGLADVFYANGGSLALVNFLKANSLYERLYSLSAWNTSANTLGTALADLVISYIFKKKFTRLIKLHYLDDYLYQGFIRSKLNNYLCSKGINIYALDNYQKNLALKYIKQYLPNVRYDLPLNRTFEIELVV